MKLRERRKKNDVEDDNKPENVVKSRKSKKQRTTKDSGLSSVKDVTLPVSINKFIASIENESLRKDAQELHELVTRLSPDLEPTLEFKNTLGYGKYHYKYKTGREGDWFKIGIFCGKKISLHFCGLVDRKYVLEKIAKNIGKAKCGKGCLRFNKLSDLNKPVLEELIKATATADLMT
jgi:hypothetical protein